MGGRGGRRGRAFSGLSDGSLISASALSWDLIGEAVIDNPPQYARRGTRLQLDLCHHIF